MTASSIILDYYKILELPRNCSQEDIIEDYRHIYIKYKQKVEKQEEITEKYRNLSLKNKQKVATQENTEK